MTKGPEKKHAACDECRTRKLKCSGESPKCSRCLREDVLCIYSPQKPMGRPKKRYRTEFEEVTQGAQSGVATAATASTSAEIVPYSANQYFEVPNFHHDVDIQQDLFAASIHPSLYGEDPLEHTDGFDTHNSELSTPLDVASNSSLAPHSPFGGGGPEYGQLPGISSCACLSNMYLTLSSLQSLTSFSFPFTLTPLRSALKLAFEVVNCDICPKDLLLSLQNTSLLNTLLMSIGERFHRLLMAIDDEAQRAADMGTRKRMRVGEHNPENGMMHTGPPECPMGFEVELNAADWKRMARQAVRTEVMGKDGNRVTFLRVIEELEQRQIRWHDDPVMINGRAHMFGPALVDNSRCKPGEYECLRQLGVCKDVIQNMSLDE